MGKIYKLYNQKNINKSNQVRCINDNKILFKQGNKAIEIKCTRCKKIHIFEVVKKN